MPENLSWLVSEHNFDPNKQHHSETIFTIGNGYLCTRGSFEEGYPGDHPATFIHGVFDDAPVVFTEIANTINWLPITILLNGEKFAMNSGKVLEYKRELDLRNGRLTRVVRWQSPGGYTARIYLTRFANLANQHHLVQQVNISAEFDGEVEVRFALDARTDNEGLRHINFVNQMIEGATALLTGTTIHTTIQIVAAMRATVQADEEVEETWWDAPANPTKVFKCKVRVGETVETRKDVAIYTSRDREKLEQGQSLAQAAIKVLHENNWDEYNDTSHDAWQQEWERHDVIIEGDDEAQLAVRFNLFQLLIAAPRHDERVNIGAKTLSGFGYRGHAFWDTEIFMLPVFIYTAPHIAKNLLNYRYHNLAGARKKALGNHYEGAQFPWESAATGEECTPTWLPYHLDPTRMVRIWTGDIEIHISADISHAAWQYWRATGDDAWMIEKGAEIVLDTAVFWGSRAEWNPTHQRYDYNDVIGPDEYHEHVNNNAYTNRMAQWNLQTALDVLEWLKEAAPAKAGQLARDLNLSAERFAHWRDVIDKVFLRIEPNGLIEQFEGYHQRKDVNLSAMEPRARSVQEIFGIEGTNQTQVLKQPDVLMLQYLLRDEFSDESVLVNYNHYTPRTDHTFGSSLGPSIMTIMACDVGKPDDAYEHFIRTARADLRDVRGNAGDGIHAASAGGSWQAVVFGFAGLRLHPDGTYNTKARLPRHWKRLSFKFCQRGVWKTVDLRND